MTDFEELKNELKRIEDKQKFANLEIEKRLVKSETDIEEIRAALNSLKEELKNFEKEAVLPEGIVTKKDIDNVIADIKTDISALNDKVERMKEELLNLSKNSVNRSDLDGFITKSELNKLNDSISSLRSEVGSIEERVEKFEEAQRKEIEEFKAKVFERLSKMEDKLPSPESLIKIENADKLIEEFKREINELGENFQKKADESISKIKEELSIPDIVRREELQNIIRNINEIHEELNRLKRIFVASRVMEPVVIE